MPANSLGVVLVPGNPGAAAEGLGDLGFVLDGGDHDLEGAGQVDGVVLVGQGELLLLREEEPPAGGVVADVAAGGLGGQPLGHQTRVGAGAVGQLSRGSRAGGQGLVETELVADDHGAGEPGGAEVVDEPAQ